MIAAITLRFLDPFGTGKLVLFQVTYDKVRHYATSHASDPDLLCLFYPICDAFTDHIASTLQSYSLRFARIGMRTSSYLSYFSASLVASMARTFPSSTTYGRARSAARRGSGRILSSRCSW